MTASLLLLAAALATQPAASPVKVSNPAVGQDRDGYPFVEFDLKNLSDQAATSWMLNVTMRMSDGTAEQSGYGRDGLLTHAGLLPPPDRPERETVVPPHGTIRTRYPYSPQKKGVTAVSVASISVTLVIFADDSWFGSQHDVESWFMNRGNHADAIARFLPIVQTAVDAGGMVDALHAALAKLAGKDEQDFDSAERQVTRTNLQLLLDGRIKQTPVASLQHWIADLEARRATYEAHRRPKEQSPGSR